ncbi:hypothetical protein ABH894_004660 [Paenibacillus sp. RC62]
MQQLSGALVRFVQQQNLYNEAYGLFSFLLRRSIYIDNS